MATPNIPYLVPDGFPSVWIPHEPTIKQQAFLFYDGLECLFGGAAGGGKSDALLMAALQYVDIPHYRALLMRKTFAELKLPGALMERAGEWLGNKAKWNDNDKQWTFESGATLTFGYMATSNDRLRYQSAEFQFIGFDELTEFDRLDYTFMFSRLRRNMQAKDPMTGEPLGYQVPLRIRGATNPGGPGHDWVKKRFIDKIPAEGESFEQAQERIFISSRLDDNPYIDQKMYLRSLMELDAQQRKQLLEGDWNAREPGDWVIPDSRHIDAAEAMGERLALAHGTRNLEPRGGMIASCIDWGEITQSYVIWPLEDGGVYVPLSEVKAEHLEPGDTTEAIIMRALAFGYEISDVRYDAAGVQSMRTFIKTARAVPGLENLRSTKIPFAAYKTQSMNYLRFLMRRTYEGHTTRIIGIHPGNEELIRQLRAWKRKGPETQDVEKVDDHGPDALLAGIAPYARRFADAQAQIKAESYQHLKNSHQRTGSKPKPMGVPTDQGGIHLTPEQEYLRFVAEARRTARKTRR